MNKLCLFFNTENNPGKTVKYLSGVSCDFCILVTFPRKKPVLFISSLEEVPKTNKVDVRVLSTFGDVFSLIKKSNKKELGLNFSEISKSLFDMIKKELKGVKLVDVSKDVMRDRLIKKPSEVKDLKEAISITETIISRLVKKLSSFIYEVQAIKFIQQQMIEFGVKQSFDPIVASGKNASNPHYFPKKTSKLLKGFCIIDMGVKVNGYCADISRTVFIGTPSTKDKEFYNTVLSELKRIESSVKVGSKKFSTGFKMIHALGHGIGLNVHEPPYVGVEKLKENMCLAIEPAKYTKSCGVRIEDDYVVKKSGLVRLSSSSQELIIVKKK